MRKSIRRLSVLVFVGILFLSGCSQKNDDVFKVGLEAGYAPFNWTQLDDSNGGVAIEDSKEFAGGYDVEIAKRIAKSLNKELVIVKIGWEGLVPAVDSGVVDAIIAGMSPTEKRKESIDFSANYYKSDLVLVVKKGGDYADASRLSDFENATVTAQQNTFHYSVIDQIEGVNKDTAMSNFPAMRVALESGIIDAYVSERPEGVSASAANDNFLMIELEDGFQTSDDDTAIAVGLKKGNSQIEEINKAIEEITAEERQAIMDEAIKNQPAAQ